MNTGLVRPNGAAITRGEVARARANASGIEFGRAHDGAGRDNFFTAHWNTSLRSADAAWIPERNIAVARGRDLVRNDVVASSAVNRRVNSAVGFQWRMSSLVNGRALGLSPEQVRELRADIEANFHPYAYGITFQADAERKKTLGQLLRTAAWHLAGPDGEALGLIEWAPEDGLPFSTCLRMVDPDRLSNPMGKPDSLTLRGGVETDIRGAPIAYHIREAHPNDLTLGAAQTMIWRRWPRYATAWRRPQVLHCFDGLRAGQTRGVSRFVAALKTFRALAKFTDATLQAVTINALLLGFIKSKSGLNAVGESFTAEDLKGFFGERDAFWEDNEITLDGVKLPVLPPGDEVSLATTARDTGGFDSFTRAMLRLIAAALGVTYEELSMDFSQTTYSSCRAAMAIAWTETLALRGLLSAQIATPFFAAWLEEAIEIGIIRLPPGAPDFIDAMDAYAQCKWIGPARGYLDPTKEIDAAAARIEAGASSLQDECDEQGKDWEEVAQQTRFERDYFQQLGIPYPGDQAALSRVAAGARDPVHNAAIDQPLKP
jgi:lambda family phage portal protein